MLKKRVFWIVIISVLVLLPLLYYTSTRKEISHADPFEAVPRDAVLILGSKDFFNKIRKRQNNEIWNELSNFPEIKKINRQIEYLDSIVNTNQSIRDLLQEKEIIFSVHQAGKDRYEFIWYIPVYEKNSEKQIIDFIQTNLKDIGQMTERKYESRKIFEVIISHDRNRDFSYTVTDGLFILSHSAILIEGAIRQLDLDNPLPEQSGFREIAITAGKNVYANLFISLKSFPELFSGLLNDPYRNNLARADELAAWSALDINIKYDALLLNGFTSTDPDKNFFMNLFLEQTPQRLEIHKVIPADFAACLAYGLENYSGFKEQYNNYLDIKGLLKAQQNEQKQLIDNYGIDPGKTFMEIIDHQFALVITDIPELSIEENTFFVIQCKNQTLAAEALEDMLEQVSLRQQLPLSQMIFEQAVASDFTQKFYQIPVPNPGNYIPGGLFKGINNHYCTFIDNYLVFGSNINTLSKYVYLNILQSTLESDLEFNRLSDYLATRSNIHLFINIPRSFALIEKYLTRQSAVAIENNKSSLLKFQAFSYQLSMENNLVYNNSFIKYSAQIKEEPRTVWESRLDNPVSGKPVLVTNHYTNEKEIFLQDEKNKIYLINNSGRILWKMELNGKINSEIYQIDYYKNGKLQLMFSTDNQILLIDRNGNYVENYPVKLRAPASAGLAVFEYEKNRDYRIFIPATDRNIYAYDVSGTLLTGWEFNRTDDPVYQPLQHFRIGERDYLVCLDKYNIYILNRKGQSRVNVRKHFPVSYRNKCILDRGTVNSNPRLMLTDTLGHVHYIYFNGETDELILNNFSSDHFFNYQDLNGDGRNEFIFLDNNELIVYNENKSKLFSRKFDSDVNAEPVIYQFSGSDYKIGVAAEDDQTIYLINNDGSLYKGFPLAGSTLFSIGLFSSSSDNFNLVVGGSDNFLYNYSVK